MDTPGVVDPRAEVDPWAVMESLPDALAVIDSGLRVRFLNAAWRRLALKTDAGPAGAPGADFIGCCAADLLPDPSDAFVWADLLRAALGGQPPEGALTVRRRSEARRHSLSIASCAIGGEAGALVVLRPAAAPSSFEWLLEQALQQTDEAVIITDSDRFPDGPRIIYANQSFERLTGYAAAESLGRSPHAILTPGGQSPISMQEAAAGRPVHAQVELRRKDGTHFAAELVMAPLHARSGAITNWVAMLRDTRRHERRAQRLRGQSLSTLAGGFAHRFNNLLAVMLGSASLALLDHPEPSPTHEALTAIHEAAHRGGALVSQLLAYAGKSRLQSEVLDINRLVAEVAGSGAVPPHVRAVLALAPDLPPVVADAEQMRRVVLHVLCNAVEAIGAAPGAVSLSTARRQVGETDAAISLVGDLPPGLYVAIEVRDSGAGLDRAALEHIFEPFFSTKFTGRGLGLAESLGVVTSHGGGMLVESAVGVGSAVTVLLPPA